MRYLNVTNFSLLSFKFKKRLAHLESYSSMMWQEWCLTLGPGFHRETKSRGGNELLVLWKSLVRNLTDFAGNGVHPWQSLPLQKALFW